MVGSKMTSDLHRSVVQSFEKADVVHVFLSTVFVSSIFNLAIMRKCMPCEERINE